MRDHPERLRGAEVGYRRGRTLLHLRGTPPEGGVWPEAEVLYKEGERAFDAEAPIRQRQHTIKIPRRAFTGTYPVDARIVRTRDGVDRIDSELPEPGVTVETYTPPAFRLRGS